MTARAGLTAPVEWKAAEGSSTGELEGYASVFGNVDQGGDVVLPGAFRKTLADWSRSKLPLPLIADHDLSTDGVIGSVADAKEDGYGLRVRARFSSITKAQDIRTKMVEGHLRGMSFTYDAVRHHRGQHNGQQVRFLDELRLFEATVTPFPMNTLAVAAAKGPGGDADDDVAQLERLEAWAAEAEARDDLAYLVRNPETMAHIAGTLLEAKAQSQLAGLEAWAAAQPPIRHDPQAEAREMQRIRMAKANEYSTGLHEVMARPAECAHRSCLGGRCVYR